MLILLGEILKEKDGTDGKSRIRRFKLLNGQSRVGQVGSSFGCSDDGNSCRFRILHQRHSLFKVNGSFAEVFELFHNFLSFQQSGNHQIPLLWQFIQQQPTTSTTGLLQSAGHATEWLRWAGRNERSDESNESRADALLWGIPQRGWHTAQKCGHWFGVTGQFTGPATELLSLAGEQRLH